LKKERKTVKIKPYTMRTDKKTEKHIEAGKEKER
jgi:hypothetical protein